MVYFLTVRFDAPETEYYYFIDVYNFYTRFEEENTGIE